MVGGESPHVDFDYYVEIVSKLHAAMPDVHLKLFTASEIHHMSKLAGITHEAVLRELKAAGLGSLPGGGAEVFADRVRRLVAPGKEHPDEWFDVHRTAGFVAEKLKAFGCDEVVTGSFSTVPRGRSASSCVRTWASSSSRRSVPSKRISPCGIRPGGCGIRRMIDKAVTDLPQPDSPTMPRVEAWGTVKETSSITRT